MFLYHSWFISFLTRPAGLRFITFLKMTGMCWVVSRNPMDFHYIMADQSAYTMALLQMDLPMKEAANRLHMFQCQWHLINGFMLTPWMMISFCVFVKKAELLISHRRSDEQKIKKKNKKYCAYGTTIEIFASELWFSRVRRASDLYSLQQKSAWGVAIKWGER